ncbi:MAG: hypothetical protein CL755_00570 [Chloroflexi bacterium]|nr:hypothetical protein [Chloroflexota bacterium]
MFYYIPASLGVKRSQFWRRRCICRPAGYLAVSGGASIVQNILRQRYLNSYNYRRTEGWDSSRRRPGQNWPGRLIWLGDLTCALVP